MSHEEAADSNLYSLGPTLVEYPVFPGSKMAEKKFDTGKPLPKSSIIRKDILIKKKYISSPRKEIKVPKLKSKTP